MTTLVISERHGRNTSTFAERVARQLGGTIPLPRATETIDALPSDSARMIRNQPPATRVHHAQVRFP